MVELPGGLLVRRVSSTRSTGEEGEQRRVELLGVADVAAVRSVGDHVQLTARDGFMGALTGAFEGHHAVAVTVDHQGRNTDLGQVATEVGRTERLHAPQGRALIGLLAEGDRFLALRLGHLELVPDGVELRGELVEEAVAVGLETRLHLVGLCLSSGPSGLSSVLAR